MSSSNDTINTVVVYHSGYGHTKRMAEAVADGAGAVIFAIDADGVLPEAGWSALDAADAIIFGAPTYMGGPSWQFKKFADETLRAWFELRWKDKVFGGFTNSASINGDKLNTIQYFLLLAGQHGGLWVSLAIKPANFKASKRDDLNRMGSYIAPMAQSGCRCQSRRNVIRRSRNRQGLRCIPATRVARRLAEAARA